MAAQEPAPDAAGNAAGQDGGNAVAAQATGVQGMVERQIRQAQERGAFDNLPGAGRPLRDLGGPHDENWWLRQHLLREGVSGAAFLPPALALRKEIEDLPGRVRELATEAQVRLAVDRLNERISDALRKPGDGPSVTVMAVDAEEIVLGWRFARIARRQPVRPPPPADEPEPQPVRRPRRWRRS
jgi:hypothetical protein